MPASDYCLIFGIAASAHGYDVESAVSERVRCTGVLQELYRPVGVRAGSLDIAGFAPREEQRLAFLGDLLLAGHWRRFDVARLRTAGHAVDLQAVVLEGVEESTADALHRALAPVRYYIGVVRLEPKSPIHQRFVYESVSPRFWAFLPAPAMPTDLDFGGPSRAGRPAA